MERKASASQKKYKEAAQDSNLESKYIALEHDMEALTMKMEEEKALEAEAFNIRHTDQR